MNTDERDGSDFLFQSNFEPRPGGFIINGKFYTPAERDAEYQRRVESGRRSRNKRRGKRRGKPNSVTWRKDKERSVCARY